MRAPERLWSMPLEGDEVATLVVDDRGGVAVSTWRQRLEARPGGFDPTASGASSTARGWQHHNLYAHDSYGFDAHGILAWRHRKLRIVRAIPEGWAALTDRHDLLVIDHDGRKTRRRRLEGDTWRICGWRAGNPIVSSDRDAIWVDPHVYTARGRALQRADDTGSLASVDFDRAPFDAACVGELPPLPDSFVFPTRLQLIADRGSLIATHRLHLAWLARITLAGELSWVRLVDHACCNSACVVGDRIAHTSSCGSKVTLFGGDGELLASRCVPHALDAIADHRGGLCVRTLGGVAGFDGVLEPTWTLDTDEIPHVTACSGSLYVAAGRPGSLVLTAYALPWSRS